MKELSGEGLKRKYSELLEKVAIEDLQDILSILYADPKVLLSQIGDDTVIFDELEKKDQDLHRKNWSRLFMIETERYEKLYSDLEKKFDVFKEEIVENSFNERTKAFTGMDSGLPGSFPKIPLLIETVVEQINLLKTGQAIPDSKQIKKIECFTSLTSDKDYKIVINGEYGKSLQVSRNTKTWNKFMELIENGHLERTRENKDLYDYLNFNALNKLTKQSGYPIQAIIEQRADSYIPLFEIELNTEKALVQRQNKAKEST